MIGPNGAGYKKTKTALVQPFVNIGRFIDVEPWLAPEVEQNLNTIGESQADG